MGALAFFPWLRLTEPVSAGAHSLLLYSPGAPIPRDIESATDVRTAEKILRQYKVRRQESISTLNLLLRQGRPVGFDMSDAERDEAYAFSRHLAVAGLTARSFVGSPWEFSATGHFQLVVQPFTTPFSGSVAYRNRIKGGSSTVTTSVDVHDWYLPSHLLQPAKPPIDTSLLAALQCPHDPKDRAWRNIDASLTQFLLANSSSPDVPFDVETHATYAAIERVCDADHTMKDCIAKVLRLLETAHGHPSALSIRDELELSTDQVETAVAEFLHALYVVRGALSHGHPLQYTKKWEELDLHVAGAFLFPLLLKCRLASLGAYELTLCDVAEVTGLGLILPRRPFAERADEGGKTQWEQSIERVGEALVTVEIRLSMAKAAALGDKGQ